MVLRALLCPPVRHFSCATKIQLGLLPRPPLPPRGITLCVAAAPPCPPEARSLPPPIFLGLRPNELFLSCRQTSTGSPRFRGRSKGNNHGTSTTTELSVTRPLVHSDDRKDQRPRSLSPNAQPSPEQFTSAKPLHQSLTPPPLEPPTARVGTSNGSRRGICCFPTLSPFSLLHAFFQSPSRPGPLVG